MEYVKIYALVDPSTNEVRYIGKTRLALTRRLGGHLNRSKDASRAYPVVNWIRKVLATGQQPRIKLIEMVREDQWQQRERYWIQHYRNIGNLTNFEAGGGGHCRSYGFKNRRHTEETKAKCSLIRTGRSINQNDYNGRRRAGIIAHYAKTRRPVAQIDAHGNVIRQWNSSVEAASILSLQNSNIIRSCKSDTRTCGGFRWKYIDTE